MRINNRKFEKILVNHKKKIGALGKVLEEDRGGDKERIKKDLENLFTMTRNQSRELCLVSSDFKCEKCGCNKNLQIHHLISRKSKEFMPFNKYVTQRYYWANQIILCNKCHQKYHQDMSHEGGQEENFTLDEKFIGKIKKKYTK